MQSNGAIEQGKGSRSRVLALILTCAAGLACTGHVSAEPTMVSVPEPDAQVQAPAHAPAQAAAHAIVLTARSNGGATLGLELSGDVGYEIAALTKPDRLIIDLPKVAFAPQMTKGALKAGPISAFRYGLFIADRSRIVLDLAEPALVERIDVAEADGRKRVLIHMNRVDRAKFADVAGRDAARKRSALALAPAQVQPAKPISNRPVVVIDPGHGGIDGGAVTKDGDIEKGIVLSLALAVRDALVRNGRVKVEMTRADDSFVALGDRVKFAREQRADLMVSLHADKLVHEKGVRGASIYTVSEKASDVISAKLADSENAADQAAGIDSAADDGGVIGDILFDLTKRETRQSSIALARALNGTLPQITSMHKNALRFAGFRVLTAPDVPSVLIETGYLSSAEDAKAMKTAEWRNAMASAIATAIEKYLGENATRVTNSAARP